MSDRRNLESVFGSAQVALVLMVLAATARRVVLRILTPRSAYARVMNPAEHRADDELPRLSMEEIHRRYPDQYVILDDLILPSETTGVLGGRVISCGPTRQEVFARAPSLVGKSWALWFTGEIKLPPFWMGGMGMR